MATQVVKIRRKKDGESKGVAFKWVAKNTQTGVVTTSQQKVKTVRVRSGNVYKALRGID